MAPGGGQVDATRSERARALGPLEQRDRHALALWPLLFIPLSVVVAVSFAFPLFLGPREPALRSTTRTRFAPSTEGAPT